MTQAFNLSQLANKVNTSGELNASTGLSSTVPVDHGGTGLTSVGTSGNVLTSNGSVWTSTAIPAPTIADGSVTDPKISDNITAGSNYIPMQSARISRSASPNYTSLTKFAEGYIFRGGVFNFRLKLFNGNTGEADGTKTLYARLYRDGVAISSELSASVPINSESGFITFSNITVTGQGLIQVYLRGPNLGYVLGFSSMQYGITAPVRIAPLALLGSTL
jgi:hypothetical protein